MSILSDAASTIDEGTLSPAITRHRRIEENGALGKREKAGGGGGGQLE